MTQILNNLTEPSEFWEYFKKITSIPRCSGNEKLIKEYVKNKAQKYGFNSREDAVGNLVVKIPSNTGKINKTLILQSHLDMVCEKNEYTEHDFSKDAIPLQIVEIEDKRWVSAKGTTLGADNGVEIAYLLTLMKKINEKRLMFDNIAFEMLFTVDEEVGLVGAFNIDESLITGDILINLDSEEDDTFTIGCAGGINTTATLEGSTIFEVFPSENKILMKLTVEGLHGGHSGVDIHKGFANAIKIIAKILWKINNQIGLDLIQINGGNRANAIPREASAIILLDTNQKTEVQELVNQIISEIKLGISKIEPQHKISLTTIPEIKFNKKISSPIKDKLLHILYIIPNGPISYDAKNKDLVYTSTNLASIKTEDSGIQINTSQRSLHEISKKIIYEQIEALFNLADLDFRIEHRGNYPGWTPEWDSELVKNSKQTYQTLFNEEPNIQVIHAGLECGILKEHFPQMDAISIGPTIINPHSPEERLEVESIPKFWKFLVHLLKHYM